MAYRVQIQFEETELHVDGEIDPDTEKFDAHAVKTVSGDDITDLVFALLRQNRAMNDKFDALTLEAFRADYLWWKGEAA